ncbi:MAG TPA: medium chain dehydrogenase/reductase family protein [Myxococcota bacterium]|nr:medium chain dehydrogenase/reductase family protein [Myxococcota bacterium]
MRRVWIPRTGGPEVMEVREEADPTPGPGQVRVRVEAAGVNFADLMMRMGLYPDAPPLPAVPGYEVSGTIDQVGPGVDPSRVGAPVVAMTRFGGYAEAVVVDDVQASTRPPGMDAITGAAVPVVGLTAWMMLEVMGRVQPGDRVLVHSAGGGVGLAALDLIRYRGGYAIGTASTSKHAFLRERGFDELIDYTRVDFEEALRGKPGLDIILDPVGGDSWAKGLRLLRAGGRLICYGMSSNAQGTSRSLLSLLRNMWAVPWRSVNPISLMNENHGVLGVNMGHLWDEGERVGGWLDALMARWSEGHLRPHVHATVPFSRAAEAHHILHRRENLGKVILVPG